MLQQLPLVLIMRLITGCAVILIVINSEIESKILFWWFKKNLEIRICVLQEYSHIDGPPEVAVQH